MINTIAKIFAILLKIINLPLTFLLIFKTLAEIAGIIFYILIIPLVGFCLLDETPDWETALTALMFPTVITFSGSVLKGITILINKFSDWLINTDHRSARVQNEEYIRKMKLEEMRKNSSGNDEEIQKLAEKLLELHKHGR